MGTGTPRLDVGRIGRVHGLRGDVHVVAISNRPERFAPGSHVFVAGRELVIETSRAAGNGWIVHLSGVDDRDAAEALRGETVQGQAAGDAPEGELWVHELIGCDVRDRAGTPLGRVEAVQANPAHDLLVLDGGVLIPVVFVVESRPGELVVDVPDGLLDL